MALKEKVKDLPSGSGVYIMKDAHGKILYIGKARNLRKRVSSYFYSRTLPSAKTQVMLAKIAGIDHLPTSCEAEALILESSLIKRYQPKYNVALRDDKSYPYLRLSVNETYPRLLITRRVRNDGSRYFGPYANAGLLRQAVTMIRRIFPLRTCNKLPRHRCLNYHLKQCPGPCEGGADRRHYGEIVRELALFLEGKKDILLKALTRKMIRRSREMKFEEAARIRDRIEALGTAVEGRVKFQMKQVLEELRQLLRLKSPPRRIEAFDISNISGDKAVGSMIAFDTVKFDKARYRKFKIKTVHGIDDYKMMQEIVGRHYRRLLDERGTLPDLVIIDGGRGHLGAVRRQLNELGMHAVPVIGIAKEFEHIYVLGQREPIRLPRNSGALYLIQRLRDEAHRFAISYHRRLRSKESAASVLDEIKGIGPGRKRELMKYFGDVGRIRQARMEELLKVKSINRKIADGIVQYFKNR